MDKNKLEKLGSDWNNLNGIYDKYIQELIETSEPKQLTSERIEELKKMQQELYEIETELFKLLQSEVI